MNTGSFPPAKRQGMIVHVLITAVLAGLSAWAFISLSRAQVGPPIIVYLLVILLTLPPLPFFAYRAYALQRADYILDRDSLAIHWGLRVEDIPLADIEWIRPVTDLTTPLRLPVFRLPGAVLGLRRHPDLGVVEFLASESGNLLLVATAKRVFAISPTNAAEFASTFRRSIELGSLSPAPYKSVYPSFIFNRAWESPLARFLWLSGLLLNLGLAAWVSFLIPSIERVALGFDPLGAPLEAVPSVRLIIVPLVSGLLFITGWLAGLFFFRFEKQRPLAFIVWLSSALCGLLFLLAMLFIVTTPV